ncbi:putative Universal stress protein MSMEG_3950/MSMEI_3859 [Candidatus Hydrogenisulfobacillus filiaventi]|uniref:Putative Universal stress protein MSMEG_3950/MSMEI_3859 n=1 Tax=Candidatus Hydrogenisulfobacillus filiaventi TaxID=2707344 RepID=A0A6F8ZDW2_9FIRM|nr:universal stress protein [Bacillota bacterium]CAB1127642.1 putative Universal stress protein MSMEG_3950/MSMEI_3859 [Candidatus Hydrogenisulfobacillus filiaventi]
MAVDVWVGVDGSQPATEAVRVAATVARALGWGLTVAAVDVTAGGYGPYGITTEHLDRQMQAVLAEALAQARTVAEAEGTAAATRVLKADAPAGLWDRAAAGPALCAAAGAAQAALLVVGSGGHGLAATVLLGSVSDYLANRCPIDLLVVRPGSRPRAPVLAGTDGSPAGMRAVRRAAVLARALGQPLVIATISEPSRTEEVLRRAQPDLGRTVDDLLRRDRAAILEAAQAAAAEAGAPVVSVREAVGPAAPALVELAQNAECGWLVVGSHGHSGWTSHVLLGSVSDRLLHLSPLPVWIVREGA